jgi:hypothetical protein
MTYLRASLVLAFSLAAMLGVMPMIGCGDSGDLSADVCEAAADKLSACGVSLPVSTRGACVGTRRLAAECMVHHADGCDQLASLLQRIDACVSDIQSTESGLPEGVALPSMDGGADAGRSEAGRTDPAVGSDAGSQPQPETDGGSADAGATGPDVPTAWSLVVAGTVAIAEEKRYQTPLLPAGTYRFDLHGSDGDADLYVRKGAPPQINTYDCRPFQLDSEESCTLTVTVDTVFHIMVRGEVTSSSFQLEARP